MFEASTFEYVELEAKETLVLLEILDYIIVDRNLVRICTYELAVEENG